MKLPKSINNFRRKLMQRLTKNIGSSDFRIRNYNNSIDIKRILICRPNHRLGNLLLITPLIEEIANTFPNCKIDLFVRGGLASIIFKNYPSINHIISLPKKPFKELFKYLMAWFKLRKNAYDIVVNVDSKSSSGRLSTKFAKAKIKFFGDETNENTSSKPNDYIHFAKCPIYNLRANLNLLGIASSKNSIPNLDLKLSSDEISEGKKIVDKLVKNNQKTISIFTYATGVKCHSGNWWVAFYGRLKTAFPSYNIIEILPVENVSQIGFKAISFYSKDVREIASVIRNTSIFIGADSGIMHLASASKTPTVGLFSATKSIKYEPYNDGSLAVNTNETNADQLIQIVTTILSKN